MRSLVIAVRSDVLFAMNPFIFCDSAIEKFLNVTLARTADQIARLLEMWSIHGPEGAHAVCYPSYATNPSAGLVSAEPKNAPELKKDVRMLIQTKLGAHGRARSLRLLTCPTEDVIALRYPGQVVNVNMVYTSYDEEIVARHRVRLVGWTFAGGRVTNPGSLTMPDLRALYKALINRQVFWELVPTDGDGDGDGEGGPSTSAAPRKRKVRSNKGKTRGPQKAAKAAAGASAGASGRGKKGRRKKQAADESSSEGSSSDSD